MSHCIGISSWSCCQCSLYWLWQPAYLYFILSDTADILSVQRCKFDLWPCWTFISDKAIWSQAAATSVFHSLNILSVCVGCQCTASGQTALSYLESLHDKASPAAQACRYRSGLKDKAGDILCYSYCQQITWKDQNKHVLSVYPKPDKADFCMP